MVTTLATMKDIITDLRDLGDEQLIRKLVECRKQANELERYQEADVVRARKELRRFVTRMQAELERRAHRFENP